MNCPNWSALVEERDHRESRRQAGFEGPWRQAIEHRASCPDCREAAVAADPLLLFQDDLEWSPAEPEVVSMQEAVLASVRVADLTERVGSQRALPAWQREGRRLLRFLQSKWQRAGDLATPQGAAWASLAAVAVLAVSTLLLRPDFLAIDAGNPVAAPVSAEAVVEPVPATIPASILGAPAVEIVGSRPTSIYQLSGEQMNVVLLVDRSLEF